MQQENKCVQVCVSMSKYCVIAYVITKEILKENMGYAPEFTPKSKSSMYKEHVNPGRS